jgi:HupE / UreJ protein
MNARLFAAVAILLSVGTSAFAHRLDEYLQATIISVERNHIQVSMRLIPGVAVASTVLANIDANSDGVISADEQRAYAERVLSDLSITVDGTSARPALISQKFPPIAEIEEGIGEIRIEFTVDLASGGPERKIVIENRHENGISVYLVNCLVPADPDIRVLAQNRNVTQSFYQLDYAQGASRADSASLTGRPDGWTSRVGFASVFRLGMRHIAEGTDHLLFLLALLLPAPLMVIGSHWAGFAEVHRGLQRILKIVTAFTIGHSITLMLAASGLVRAPSRPIEVLIAFSILISAIHALRPMFPGQEAQIAAFFGLIHGLAFAATLDELGLGRWERVGGILAFNLGIETMQLVVVAVILPSLILLSRTRGYRFLRISGAAFAGSASVGWIGERLFGLHSSVDAVVGVVAHHAVWIAGGLFSISLLCWSLRKILGRLAPTILGCEARYQRQGFLFASALVANFFARDEGRFQLSHEFQKRHGSLEGANHG